MCVQHTHLCTPSWPSDGDFWSLPASESDFSKSEAPSISGEAGRHLSIAHMSEVSPVCVRLLESRQVSD